MSWVVPYNIFQSYLKSPWRAVELQARHNFSKNEGAAQKQNIKNDLTFNVFGVKFQG